MPPAPVTRDLHLVSPHTSGDDVKTLQHALNHIGHDLWPDYCDYGHVTEDGECGPITFSAAHRAGYVIGLAGSTVDEIGHKHVLVQGAQNDLRRPDALAPDQQQRGKDNRAAIDHKRAQNQAGADEAVKWALSKEGMKESPLGSNRGPEIDQWEQECFGGVGQPWCGCFVCHAVVIVGKAQIPSRSRLAYTPNIDYDAAHNLNGLRRISPSAALPGDIVTFNFGQGAPSQHTGIVVSAGDAGGVLHTIEGNTSSSGSQDNGGEVGRHTRPLSQVVTVARPTYA